jgi:ACS family hexuronate transporter-like MFS transporter
MKIYFGVGVRWRICALLFFAITINYMDRQIFGILAPTLQAEIGWTESQYGFIVAAFTLAYAFGLLFVGRLLDWIGVKKGFGLAVFGWSLAAMGHALANTPIGFAIARLFLGLTESGNFPAAIKAIAEWFPKKERSLATGILNSGANIGIMAAALLVPMLTVHYGWKMAFLVQGSIGFIWLLFLLFVYQKPSVHKKLSHAERSHIGCDQQRPVQTPLPLKTFLTSKNAWAFIIGKLMTDPVWWFYLYWLPKYLVNDHGIVLGTLALPLIIIYMFSDIGSVAGGWLTGWLIKKNHSPYQARKLTLFICALCVMPTVLLPWVSQMWLTILLISLATAGHQGWSANLFSLPADFFPQCSVGTLVGIGGFFGAMGGIMFQVTTGYILQSNANNYSPLFLMCGMAYLIAWIIIHQLTTATYVEFSDNVINASIS